MKKQSILAFSIAIIQKKSKNRCKEKKSSNGF
jgi:hypothetical protein